MSINPNLENEQKALKDLEELIKNEIPEVEDIVIGEYSFGKKTKNNVIIKLRLSRKLNRFYYSFGFNNQAQRLPESIGNFFFIRSAKSK